MAPDNDRNCKREIGENIVAVESGPENEFEVTSADGFSDFIDGILPETMTDEKEAAERLSMARFLQTFFDEGALDFPLKVSHTSNRKPDFQLCFGQRRIAVESSRIAVEQLQRARKFQKLQKPETGDPQHTSRLALDATTLFGSNLPRKTPTVYNLAFTNPVFSNARALDDQIQFWCEKLEESLQAKTQKRQSDAFEHGEEDWLLLWDQLPIDAWSPGARVERIERILTPYWQPGWFRKVFIQHSRFESLIVCH